jgi:hypothetical protein
MHELLAALDRRLFLIALTGGLLTVAGFGLSAVHAQPSSTTCTVLGAAHSAFWYREGIWSGDVPREGKARPGRFVIEEPVAMPTPTELILSRLDDQRPVVRLVFQRQGGAEVQASVLSRSSDSMFFVFAWVPGSEWYVVALDFKTRRATIGSVATGVTAIGGTLAIAECR